MLEDLIIETEYIDTSNLSEQKKVIIDCIEETEIIEFDLTRNYINFKNKDDGLINCWELKRDDFFYSYWKIYQILENKFGYKEQKIDDLVKDILMKHYEIKVSYCY